MLELLNKSDVMRIINSENAVVLCCTRLRSVDEVLCSIVSQINSLQTIQTTIEAEPVRHGRWIECDYKHMEHGMIETEPKAGLCCSECRTAFQKKKMTYKQYCAACGARMDATDTNVGGKGGDDNDSTRTD